MSLTINDYKNWAVNDQQTAVALDADGNGLVSETDRMSGIARVFCRGDGKKMRGDVLNDFTRALSVRYGESIAHQAVSMAGLSSSSSLRGWKIARAIQAAKDLRAQLLRPAAERNLTLGNTEVSAASVGVLLGDKGNGIAKFLKQRAVAVQLLGEISTTAQGSSSRASPCCVAAHLSRKAYRWRIFRRRWTASSSPSTTGRTRCPS